MLLFDRCHVAVPPRPFLKPRQPEFRRTQWPVEVAACPAAEPDVRDALREDKVIDVLNCPVAVRIGQAIEVVAALLVSPRKQEEVPLNCWLS